MSKFHVKHEQRIENYKLFGIKIVVAKCQKKILLLISFR